MCRDKEIVHYLSKLGYRIGIAGKIHVSLEKVFPFEKVEGIEWHCVSLTAGFDDAELCKFINRDRSQPFCLVAALIVPHIPWTVGDFIPFYSMATKPFPLFGRYP